MDEFSGLKFSDIKNCDIIDSEGERVGRLIDAVFKPSETGMVLRKFIVGGSRWEELLEDLGFRDDIDPVFPVETIDRVTAKHIRLNCTKDELKSTHVDSDAIESDELKLSALSKYQLIDSKDAKIGNIVDLQFESGAFQFIIGDGPFIEWAEDIGLLTDIDFLLSPKYISKFGDKQITLSQEKAELKETFEKSIETMHAREAKQESELARASGFMYFPKFM